MTLSVEDGTGIAGADSYATIDEFKAYWGKYGASEAVNQADDCKIETAMRIATQYLETNCGGSFIGFKNTKAQGLHFPVNNGVRNDGFTLDSNEIPQEVKNAQFELASRHIEGTDLFDSDQVGGVGNIKSIKKKVASIEKTIEYTESGQEIYTVFPKVGQILAPITRNTSGYGSVIRN